MSNNEIKHIMISPNVQITMHSSQLQIIFESNDKEDINNETVESKEKLIEIIN